MIQNSWLIIIAPEKYHLQSIIIYYTIDTSTIYDYTDTLLIIIMLGECLYPLQVRAGVTIYTPPKHWVLECQVRRLPGGFVYRMLGQCGTDMIYPSTTHRFDLFKLIPVGIAVLLCLRKHTYINNTRHNYIAATLQNKYNNNALDTNTKNLQTQKTYNN